MVEGCGGVGVCVGEGEGNPYECQVVIVRPAGPPLCGKTNTQNPYKTKQQQRNNNKTTPLDITRKLFSQVILICLAYFTSLSQTLTLTGGHKVSAKENLMAACSRTLFN